MLGFIGFLILLGLFSFIIILQLKVLYKRDIIKKVCLEIDGFKLMSLISAIWVLFIIVYAIYSYTFPIKEPIRLNEWGDFLAGFFAPLLFLWLVYGVLIQKIELATVSESSQSQTKKMQEQVAQTEIQQLNIWFNRNLKNIQTIKLSIFKVSNGDFNSIAEVAIELEKDITSTQKNYILVDDKYFKIYDDLKNIFDTIIYIQNYLDEQLIKYEEKDTKWESINEIKNEFLVLFKHELKDLKKILSVVYFLIALNKRSGYEKYLAYAHWLDGNATTSDIYNEIISMSKTTVDEILSEVLKNYEKINIDFKTWKIRK